MASGLSTSGAVAVVVQGVPEVRAALIQLGTRGARNASNKALRAGLKPVTAAVRRHTRQDVGKVTGLFGKSAGGRVGKVKRTGIFRAAAGLNVGKKKTKLGEAFKSSGDGWKRRERVATGNYAPHAAMIALGTKIRKTKSGANRGKMPATPVVPRAHSESKSMVLNEMKKNIRIGIQQETIKARARTK